MKPTVDLLIRPQHTFVTAPESTPVPRLDLSIVIPVYNSQRTISELLRRLTQALNPLTDDYQIILVDDGSPDGSWAEIESVRESYGDKLVAVQLMRNYGQHNALMCEIGRAHV